MDQKLKKGFKEPKMRIDEGEAAIDETTFNLESHPPIDDDLDGIATLLRQKFLQYADCNLLAQHLIDLKEVTQVMAQGEASEGEDDDEDEPDDNIYGVTSLIEFPINDQTKAGSQLDARENLTKFITDKCPEFRKTIETSCDNGALRIGVIINERYINIPPQLSVPALKNLTQHIDNEHFTHLVLVAKVLLRSRNTDTKLPSKKAKTSSSKKPNEEMIIYVNAEEEIIFENCEYYSDVDVSTQCDENASWSLNSDVKYIPHRRIMVIDHKKWSAILQKLEEELK